MKLFVSIGIALVVSYIALVIALNHLSSGSDLACGQDFTLPGLACRIGAMGVTLLLVPISGILAFFAARKVLAK